MFIRIFFIAIIFFAVHACDVDAYVPRFDVPEDQQDVVVVDEPELSQAFHGELADFPHTYEIVASEEFNLYVEILVPDIDSSENIISGIIIKEQEDSGRVIEVTRLKAVDASWESQKNKEFDEWYRVGPKFEEVLEAGTYRIETNTPDNIGKYVLVVGANDEMDIGYFDYIGRMVDVKKFSERSPFLIILSPYIYIPILIIGIVWFSVRRYRAQINNDEDGDDILNV